MIMIIEAMKYRAYNLINVILSSNSSNKNAALQMDPKLIVNLNA